MSPDLSLLDATGVVAVVTLVAIVGVLSRRRSAPSATPLTLFVGSLATWGWAVLVVPVLGTGLDSAVLETEYWSVVGTAGALFTPLFWFWYAVEYSGRGRLLTPVRLAVLAAPVVLAVATASGILAIGDAPGGVVNLGLTLFVFLEVLYSLGLVVLGAYLLTRLSLTYRQLPVGQVGALAVATTAPYVASLVSNVTQPRGGEMVPVVPVDVTAVGFLAAAALLSVAVWRYQVVAVLPEAETVARDQVVEDLQEGVVVLDQSGGMLDLNAAAARLVDGAPIDALGSDVESALGLPVDALDDEPRTVALDTSDGVRQFEIKGSSLGPDEDPVGRTVVLRDVTERERRDQRLQVLNRVLRHNLRNDLDVILAHAETVEDPETRRAIRDQAQDLVDMAEKARYTEEMLDVGGDRSTMVDVAAVVRDVAGTLATSHPSAEVTTSVPEELTVRTRQTVVERLLTELVENAVEHSSADQARVEVAAARSETRDGSVELTVRDHGPGIPERELAILRDGGESQHRHSTGFGLWFVSHAVSHVGGDLSFALPEDGGTLVTVVVPELAVE